MIEFKLEGKQKVIILQNGNDVGHIFTSSSSSNDSLNAIQVCGFSEAFTLWGCGIYKGFKDIQLLYDGEKMKGRFNPSNCWCCFHDPCQCETEKDEESGITKGNPFTIKSWIKKELSQNDM